MYIPIDINEGSAIFSNHYGINIIFIIFIDNIGFKDMVMYVFWKVGGGARKGYVLYVLTIMISPY